MLATLSMSPTMDFRNSNTAGAPLPLIPRRSPSATRALHPFPSSSANTPKTSPPIKLTVQKATPPEDPAEPSSSSSSSSSDGRTTVSIRAKRVRGVRPPEQSTPTPTVFLARHQPPPPPRDADPDADDGDTTPRPVSRPLFYFPNTGVALRALSTSHIPVLAPSPSPPKPPVDETPRMVRKKSGQPVKSSLKSSAPRVRGSLAVVIGGGTSKSAPTTPTDGTRSRVHFDTQLEHVKLFLAEQKPLAVSRDGSPTDDTSGTEGDFPDWIFGREGATGRLEMAVDVPPPPGEVDVKLQALALADDGASVAGQVAVRNIAFDKWVAVRFTFDDWQTTSEVTARHAHSLPGGVVDVFSFIIRLTDLLARIEGKEMLLAVRYTSAGREMWDNNGGANYRATFKRVRSEAAKDKDAEEEKARSKARGPEGEVVADLRSRLERVVKGHGGPGPVQLRKAEADRFKAGGSLAARYDFGTSSRNPWRPTASVHQRAQSHPVLDSPSPPSTIPWPSVPKAAPRARPALGSPRDAGEDTAFRPAPYVTSDNEEAGFATPPARHHQRGYFDVPLRDAGGLRRTPPGTPRARALDDLAASPGRANSFPPLDPRLGLGMGLGLDLTLTPRGVRQELSSEGSTPSIVSPGSSRSGSASPVSPPDYVGLGMVMQSSANPTTYHTFLDKFCFYTGPEASGIEGLPRTQSVSSVEEFLSTASASPRLHTFVQKRAPTSPQFDDSGTTTPTFTSESRATTPVAAS
ncbi:putative phosphatase regulatory subunit-domain-containing protein [Mycena rosella]|uniref:Phosphatase regulatory subunit-domain-containing protein n=1 Tax=Mycena rosella TaxID=1033263 RepID=A0AAD7CNX8_MYCRO|nr:putative phosphatase regulatory subunit-domain-containing protein [Mycena rosella]